MKILNELLSNDSLAKLIIDNFPFPFYIHNEAGNLAFWNKKTEEMSGYNHDDIFGTHYLEFFRKEERPEIQEINKRARTIGHAEVEIKMLSKYNTTIDVLLTANRFFYDGQLFIVGFIIDLTQRVETENELKKALKHIQNLRNQLIKENNYLRDEISSNFKFNEMLFESSFIKDLMYKIEQVSKTDTTILIYGERGVGKELVARSIHKTSERSEKPFIKIDCASLSLSDLERNIFGQTHNNLTSNDNTNKIGRIEIAEGGTLYLENIDVLSLNFQEKILNLIKNQQFTSVGSKKKQEANIRIMCSSIKNIPELVNTGTIRKDLFFRINSFPISITPLRNRKEDIPILATFYLLNYCEANNLAHKRLPKTAINRMIKYDWPGNSRELQNIIERSAMVSEGKIINANSIINALTSLSKNNKQRSLKQVEKDHIKETLINTNWRIRGKFGAAELLDINPSTLESKMKKLGIFKTRKN